MFGSRRYKAAKRNSYCSSRKRTNHTFVYKNGRFFLIKTKSK